MPFMRNRQHSLYMLIIVSFAGVCFLMRTATANQKVSHATQIPMAHSALIQALNTVSQGTPDQKQKALAIILSAEPKPLLKGDDLITALTNSYQVSYSTQNTSRGHLSGPLMRTANFSGNSEEFDLVFEGGELAAVTLHNEDALSLNIYHNNTQICREEIVNNIAHCQWIPTYSTQYTIRVKGHKDNRSTYTLLVD